MDEQESRARRSRHARWRVTIRSKVVRWAWQYLKKSKLFGADNGFAAFMTVISLMAIQCCSTVHIIPQANDIEHGVAASAIIGTADSNTRCHRA